MTASPTKQLTIGLALVLALGACGDDPAKPAAPGAAPAGKPEQAAADPVQPADLSGTEPTSAEAPTAAPETFELPSMDPLDDAAAGTILGTALDALPPEGSTDAYEAAERSLGYLAELRSGDLEAAVQRTLLGVAEDGDGYDDPEYAAIGWAALRRFGAVDTEPQITELAEWALVEEEAMVAVTHAVITLDGDAVNLSDPLLVRIIENGSDEEASTDAARELARRRSEEGREAFATVAADKETYYDGQRAVAVAGLLALSDPRAQAHVDAWVAEAATSTELGDVLRALGVPGLTESLPAIRSILAAVEKTAEIDDECAQACLAVATMFEGDPKPEALAFVREAMAMEGAHCEDEGALALLILGDDSVKPAVALALGEAVRHPIQGDKEFAVELLEALARRKLATDPVFVPAVAVAARQDIPEDVNPSFRSRALATRWAAAYAHLMSVR